MRTKEPGFYGATLNPYVVQPFEVEPGDQYGYLIIAVIDDYVPLWAAYRGPTGWDDARVAREGDKISQELAEMLFPSIAASGRNYSA